MSDTQCVERPGIETARTEPEPARRILLLSGVWTMPKSCFDLEGALFAGAGGAVEGEFCWTNVDTSWMPADYVGTELVRGRLCAMRLELAGYRVDKGLACDTYRISLIGALEAGVFSGVTAAHGAWDGRMSGRYQMVVQRS